MKKNIITILIISLILLTGCESKTDQLENKINELESTIQDMSTSTTTTEATTTATETTTTSSGTKKKVAKATTTTTETTTTYISTKRSTTVKPTTTTTRKPQNNIVKDYVDDEGNTHQKYGYKTCDSNNKNCTCYFDGEEPYKCEF